MTMANIRKWHAYLGLFIAPSVLFFALTGAVQLFGLHESHGDYRPPSLLEKLSTVHKDQKFALGDHHPPPGAEGGLPKRAMLERFARGGCVLVGSQSFWEGIDVPGDALQCVLIDKLPFPPPNDPLIEAREKRLNAQGRDAFNDCFVAEAAVSLKQGAGRLIRTPTRRRLDYWR